MQKYTTNVAMTFCSLMPSRIRPQTVTAAGSAPLSAPRPLPCCCCRSFTVMKRPFWVWMVAPVVIPMSWSGTILKSKRLSSTASAMTASMRANWSPTHFRGPPLKGIYLHMARRLVKVTPCWTHQSMQASMPRHEYSYTVNPEVQPI